MECMLIYIDICASRPGSILYRFGGVRNTYSLIPVLAFRGIMPYAFTYCPIRQVRAPGISIEYIFMYISLF